MIRNRWTRRAAAVVAAAAVSSVCLVQPAGAGAYTCPGTTLIYTQSKAMPTNGHYFDYIATATNVVAIGAAFEMVAGSEWQTVDWSWAWYNLGNRYEFWWDYQKNGATGGGVYILQYCV
jgi:hypothetical protein